MGMMHRRSTNFQSGGSQLHSRMSTTGSPISNNRQTSRTHSQSNYIHYEFVPPYDDHSTRCDVVVHPNAAKVNRPHRRCNRFFSDKPGAKFLHSPPFQIITQLYAEAETKMPKFELIEPFGMLHTSTSHTYLIASTIDFITTLHHHGFKIKVWDTKDRVAARAK